MPGDCDKHLLHRIQNLEGKRYKFAGELADPASETKLPRCGVAMNTTW